MDPCHFCRKDHYNSKMQASGLVVCPECMETIQEISGVMNRERPHSQTRIVKVKDLDGSAGGMATFLPPEVYGGWDEISVIRYDTLETAVLSGWKPLMLLYKDDIDKGYDRVVAGRDQYNNESHNEFQHFAVGRIPLFLVGRTNEDRKMFRRLEETCGDNNNLLAKVKELEMRVAEEERIRKVAQAGAREFEADLLEAEKKTVKERQMRYKLEEDVSKLRKAVGELKAKELLGEEQS